jgi:hypothetical protein
MKECDNSKIHISSNFILSMSSNNVGHHITKTITTMQHFATLHHASLHLSTLHFLSFTIHYPLIWLTPFTFPVLLKILNHNLLAQKLPFSLPQILCSDYEPHGLLPHHGTADLQSLLCPFS